MDIAPLTTFDVLMYFIYGIIIGIATGYMLKTIRVKHEA